MAPTVALTYCFTMALFTFEPRQDARMDPDAIFSFEAASEAAAITRFSELWRERRAQFDGATLKDAHGKPVWFSDQVPEP